MKFLLLILIPFLIGCDKKNNTVGREYFVSGTFLDTIGVDTVFIEFTDSSISMIAYDGSFKNGTWTIKTSNDSSSLVINFRRSTTFRVIDFNPNIISLQQTDPTINEPLHLIRQDRKHSKSILGTWKSNALPPPPDELMLSHEQFDSILTDEKLWRPEIFQFTQDKVYYEFYSQRDSSSYNRPFLQIDSDLSTAFGRAEFLRVVKVSDEKLTLDVYLSRQRFSEPDTNLRLRKELIKTVANSAQSQAL